MFIRLTPTTTVNVDHITTVYLDDKRGYCVIETTTDSFRPYADKDRRYNERKFKELSLKLTENLGI